MVLASASMVLASFGVAFAHDEVADSKVTITETSEGVKGEVKSDADFCKVAREVNVFKVKPGKDKKVGSDTTNAKGKWTLNIEGAKGKYYAKVGHTLDEFENLEHYFHIHECNSAKSDNVKL